MDAGPGQIFFQAADACGNVLGEFEHGGDLLQCGCYGFGVVHEIIISRCGCCSDERRIDLEVRRAGRDPPSFSFEDRRMLTYATPTEEEQTRLIPSAASGSCQFAVPFKTRIPRYDRISDPQWLSTRSWGEFQSGSPPLDAAGIIVNMWGAVK